MSTTTAGRLSWAVVSPPAAALVLALTWGSHPSTLGNIVVGLALVAAVLAAVHHAEVVAHRVGEPFGSLLLAVAVTIIEVGLIIPAIAVASIWLEGPLALGIDPLQLVLLILSVVVSVLTVVPGRAKPLAGGVHLVLFGALLFLSAAP